MLPLVVGMVPMVGGGDKKPVAYEWFRNAVSTTSDSVEETVLNGWVGRLRGVVRECVFSAFFQRLVCQDSLR